MAGSTTCFVTYACACCMPQIKQRYAYQLRVLHCGCMCWTKSTAKQNHRNLNNMQTKTKFQLSASKQTDAAASSPCCPTLQHAWYGANTSALCCWWHSMLGNAYWSRNRSGSDPLGSAQFVRYPTAAYSTRAGCSLQPRSSKLAETSFDFTSNGMCAQASSHGKGCYMRSRCCIRLL